jgi:hypothetical protein
VITIRVSGLKEAIGRMKQFPMNLKRGLRVTMQAVLLFIWENVPPYPPQPAGTKYRRTLQLGRSLGSSETGGKSGGLPSIYEVKENAGYIKGSFGTNLGYAQYAVGDYVSQQAGHMRHWWTIPQDVLNKSFPGIVKRFELLRNNLIAFLNGKG